MIAENSLASPKLSTNLTIQVIVYDVGVQRPQFSSSQYQTEVSESVVVGTSVIKINVTNSEQVVNDFVQSYKIPSRKRAQFMVKFNQINAQFFLLQECIIPLADCHVLSYIITRMD